MDQKVRISPAKKANLHLDFYETFDDDFFNSEFIELVITGVPTDEEGQQIWECMDDLISRPYSHGLLIAISTISQIIKTIGIHLCFSDVEVPRLKIRFEAKITDVFAKDNSGINPIAWIMGLFWYVPLFIFSYDKVKPSLKFLITLPLILPPFLNISGYLAAIISLFILSFFSKDGLNSL